MAVRIRYKANGMKRSVADFVARKLVANGVATYADEPQTYMTRHMVAAPASQPAASDEIEQEDEETQAPDEYSGMDADALRALATERGVRVHHKAGAEKLREALRVAGT